MKKTLTLLFLLVLLIPVFLIRDNISFSSPTNLVYTLHRLSGLYAFNLIFIQMVLGSGMGLLGPIFKTAKIYKLHKFLGKTAFTLALIHPILLFTTYLTEKNAGYFLPYIQSGNVYYYLGVTGVGLLFISVLAAIFRQLLGPKWIYLHRLNYLIFWLIFFHSFNLGEDTQSQFAKIYYYTIAAIVGILTLRRLSFTLNLFRDSTD